MQEDSGILPKVQPVAKTKPGIGRLVKPLLLLIIIVLLIAIAVLFIYNRETNTEETQAAVLSQLVKLNDLEKFSVYKNQGGGLYKSNTNSPQLTHRILIQKQLQLIKPLGTTGVSDPDGKIGFIYLGDPYTQGEFTALADFLEGNAQVNPALVLMDSAQEPFDASYWEKSLNAWEVMNTKVEDAGITAKQVQILWINLSMGKISGDFDSDMDSQTELLEQVVKTGLIKYPNIKIVYLSSPRYAGRSRVADYQEPNSYEAAFAVRELINKQERGELKFRENLSLLDSEPALLWGPYIWNSKISEEEPFAYPVNYYAADGLILNALGKQKYVVDLFNFWVNYEFSKTWFTRSIN